MQRRFTKAHQLILLLINVGAIPARENVENKPLSRAGLAPTGGRSYMKHGMFLFLLLLFLLAMSPFVLAEDEERMPYYYGLSVGQSKFHVAGEGDPTMSVYLGRYIKKNLTIEAGYADLGEGGDPRQASSASSVYGGGSLLLVPPNLPNVSWFLTAGLSSWYYKEGSQNDSGVDLYYGFGVMVGIDRELSLRAGFNRYALNPSFPTEEFDEEITVISVGVQYRP